MSWMARERWQALVRGEDCPLCTEVTANEPESAHGYSVADLSMSRLRLVGNQWVPGYCLLICTTHVREPFELEREARIAFFEDLMRVGCALEAVYQPAKLNFQLLGNAVPHLHCHITPRYYGDPAPNRPLDPNFGTRMLAPDERAARIASLRSALAADDVPP